MVSGEGIRYGGTRPTSSPPDCPESQGSDRKPRSIVLGCNDRSGGSRPPLWWAHRPAGPGHRHEVLRSRHRSLRHPPVRLRASLKTGGATRPRPCRPAH